MRPLLLVLTLTLMSCGTPQGKSSNTYLQEDTVINFSNKLKLVGQHSKDLGGFSFNPISIYFNNNIIFTDTTNEYWLSGYDSHQYPKYLQCSDSNVQLLIEVDERPNANELLQLTISNNGQILKHRLPVFFWDPKDIMNNGKLEVQGILTNGETISTGDTAFYNPTLVYELSGNCLTLDSSATKKINSEIWGKFYGYYYNDTLLLPYKRLK
jgi:hypothetical protein